MKKTLITASAAAVVAMAAGAVSDAHAKEMKGMEKCYGVVKAGKNDCASSDGSHSCAGQAKVDAASGDWIMLPEGVCNKLTGGKVMKGHKKMGKM